MPKVDKKYFEEKKNKILDAALKVAMGKPVYEVSMRDIISESGLSQGGIYRYFANIDEIYIALINRHSISINGKEEFKRIYAKESYPEKKVYELLMVWKSIVLDNLLGVGKIYFELSTVYANDIERLNNFMSHASIGPEQNYLQEKSIMFVKEQIESGYFKPKLPFEDIIIFLITSLDGIVRDIILNKHYHIKMGLSANGELNGDKMMKTLIFAFIQLLGGNEKNIIREESFNESTTKSSAI